ncbi:hypothetical protein C7G42_24575 [Bradyrhizobium sp. MOS003]|nr:hypothetical protein C7G42_24575 [Bradyrhizobium sp. MOS003]
MAGSGLGANRDGGLLPPPLVGESWGEGVSATGQSPKGESHHPRLRRDLSRKRERLSKLSPPAHLGRRR